jgi:hypothetical protein
VTKIAGFESDPLVRGMDPRICIRIQTKISWIRNIALNLTLSDEEDEVHGGPRHGRLLPRLQPGLAKAPRRSTQLVNHTYQWFDWLIEWMFDYLPRIFPEMLIFLLCTRVSDPHWFNADPDTDLDPAFFLIADPDPGLSKIEKIYSWKFNFYFLDQKLQLTYP